MPEAKLTNNVLSFSIYQKASQKFGIINFWVCAGGMRRIYIYIYTSEVLSLYSDSVSGQCRSAIGPKVDGQHVLSMYFVFYIFD